MTDRKIKIGIYLIRWQLSTPVLGIVIISLYSLPIWESVIIANLIGGLIFYSVDRRIFQMKSK